MLNCIQHCINLFFLSTVIAFHTCDTLNNCNCIHASNHKIFCIEIHAEGVLSSLTRRLGLKRPSNEFFYKLFWRDQTFLNSLFYCILFKRYFKLSPQSFAFLFHLTLTLGFGRLRPRRFTPPIYDAYTVTAE